MSCIAMAEAARELVVEVTTSLLRGSASVPGDPFQASSATAMTKFSQWLKEYADTH